MRGKMIEAAGRDVAAPAGAKVIDLGDVTLMPGLIDVTRLKAGCFTRLKAGC